MTLSLVVLYCSWTLRVVSDNTRVEAQITQPHPLTKLVDRVHLLQGPHRILAVEATRAILPLVRMEITQETAAMVETIVLIKLVSAAASHKNHLKSHKKSGIVHSADRLSSLKCNHPPPQAVHQPEGNSGSFGMLPLSGYIELD